jgi:N-acetylmuramoyl-L-alanine amidase
MPAHLPLSVGFGRRAALAVLAGCAFSFGVGAMVRPAESRMTRTQYAVGPNDLDVCAKTVWGESRGEDFLGKVAVAWVIRNRAERAIRFRAISGKNHALFGDGSVTSACKRPNQFSCWNSGDPNACHLEKAPTKADFAECMKAVVLVMAGEIDDPTKGCCHYCVKTLHPHWAKGRKPFVVIGQHAFYANI